MSRAQLASVSSDRPNAGRFRHKEDQPRRSYGSASGFQVVTFAGLTNEAQHMNRMNTQIDRRRFLRSSLALGCGLAGVHLLDAAAQEPPATQSEEPNVFGSRAGFSPQIGVLVSMLNWMRGPVISAVRGLTRAQLDHLQDAKSNTIGALLLHLAATERLYQVHTFEGKAWGDWDEKTKEQWLVPMNLGAKARKTIKGKDLAYYVDALKQVRESTLAKLCERDDTWLMKVDGDWAWGPTNNYCKWFHVCEHESHHNGQIKWLKARLPGATAAED